MVVIGLMETRLKLQLHDAIYRLRFYSNSLIPILSLSKSHNNVASLQKNRADKSNRVIVALNEQLESHLNSRSCKHGGTLLEVVVGLICQWI